MVIRKNLFPENRKGWVRVLEVFISIVLIMGITFLVLSRIPEGRSVSSDVISSEVAILREIQLNDTLRGQILSVSTPVNWSDFESEGLGDVVDLIGEKKIINFECQSRICSLSDSCSSEVDIDEDVYAQGVLISADTASYSPRQIKIFCW